MEKQGEGFIHMNEALPLLILGKIKNRLHDPQS